MNLTYNSTIVALYIKKPINVHNDSMTTVSLYITMRIPILTDDASGIQYFQCNFIVWKSSLICEENNLLD